MKYTEPCQGNNDHSPVQSVSIGFLSGSSRCASQLTLPRCRLHSVIIDAPSRIGLVYVNVNLNGDPTSLERACACLVAYETNVRQRSKYRRLFADFNGRDSPASLFPVPGTKVRSPVHVLVARRQDSTKRLTLVLSNGDCNITGVHGTNGETVASVAIVAPQCL